MFRQYLESITGIGIYPVISLLIFFLFFTVLIAYMIKSDKNLMDEMSRIPLQNNESNPE